MNIFGKRLGCEYFWEVSVANIFGTSRGVNFFEGFTDYRSTKVRGCEFFGEFQCCEFFGSFEVVIFLGVSRL